MNIHRINYLLRQLVWSEKPCCSRFLTVSTDLSTREEMYLGAALFKNG